MACQQSALGQWRATAQVEAHATRTKGLKYSISRKVTGFQPKITSVSGSDPQPPSATLNIEALAKATLSPKLEIGLFGGISNSLVKDLSAEVGVEVKPVVTAQVNRGSPKCAATPDAAASHPLTC